jgi:hypothetical protein
MFRLNLDVIKVAALAALSLTAVNALADEPSSMSMKQDLGAFSCKDTMRLSGEDREIALALAHGYVLGKKGTTQYDVEVLAQITDQFIDYCLDHPTENALESFEKLAK